MKTRHLILAAMLFGCGVNASDPPTVTTEEVEDLTPVSVTLKGTVNPNGAVTAPFFVVNDVTIPATPVSIPAGNDPVEISLNLSISPGQSYNVHARAENVHGAVDGNWIFFSAPVPELVWDTGTTHEGTEVASSAAPPGGQTGTHFYFKVVTQGTAVGAWRTVLNVTSGSADLYLKFGDLPSTSNYSHKSDLAGSDGLVLHEWQFGENQEWFILVHASAGAEWNLVTGEAYVHDLGELAEGGGSGSGPLAMGAEGIRFFKTTIPAGAKAWRLWLNGASNTLSVRAGSLAFPGWAHDQQAAGQMLLVPPYLNSGLYYLAVADSPGIIINLDSRIQPITELSFGGNTSLSVTGYGYQTYHVDVPIEQIAWEVQTTATAGNPNVAIRRNDVPNEWYNDAFSEVSGSATDSITISPSTLSDGSFYITVYGTANYQFTLSNGNPVITDIDFASTTVNDQSAKAGWRFYRVADIEQQLGSLGWDLFLTNQPPGTELALRRNAVPSRWNYRQGNAFVQSDGHVDFSGPQGFLQRPGHQADIWYIGVYQPDEPLGAFTLNSGPLTATTTVFDHPAGVTRTATPEDKWDYFRIDVPEGAQGWDLRLTDVISGNPQLVIRRDMLLDGVGYFPSPAPWYPHFWPFFPGAWSSGHQWPADREWTGWTSTSGDSEATRILQMGMNRPLEPGTYYVGVISSSGAASYTLRSRGIGPGYTIPVSDLDYLGGIANITGLAPREAAYFAVTIPEDTPSWQLRLTPTTGEAMMSVLKDSLPNVGADSVGDATSLNNQGIKMQKTGKEHYTLLPDEYEEHIPAGVYYIAVVSEGVDPNEEGNGRIGTGGVDATLESIGPVPVTGLGTLEVDGTLLHAASLEGAETKAFQFTVEPGVRWMELRLEDKVGNPVGMVAEGTLLPAQHFSVYGLDGGGGGHLFAGEGPPVLSLIEPAPGTYSLLLRAEGIPFSSDFPDASCTLRITGHAPEDLTFDGGAVNVTDQEPGTWRFFKVTVPADALGWDLRVHSISGGRPEMIVQRDTLPSVLHSQPIFGVFGPWYKGAQWASGYTFAASGDWTGWIYDSSGDYAGDRMVMGMDRPLLPGIYHIGIYNSGGSNDPTESGSDMPGSYTLQSRGIGGSYSIPVQPLDFNGDAESITGLVAGEAAYFAVSIPEGTPNWRVKLTPTSGEALLCVAKDSIPATFTFGDATGPFFGGERMSKSGNEHYVLLPEEGESFIPAGTYYLAVVSEGLSPNEDSNHRIGTGAISATLENSSPVIVDQLGTVSDTLEIQRLGESIEGGAANAYEFTVASGLERVEIRYENRVGYPYLMSMLVPEWPGYNSNYGIDGGSSPTVVHEGDGTTTIQNPAPGIYRVLIQAGTSWPYTSYADAAFDLHITGFAAEEITVTDIDFESSTGVGSHPPNAWRYFRVEVPEGAFGWDVRLKDVAGGNPQMVVRRSAAPLYVGSGPTFGGGWQWSSNPGAFEEWPEQYQWASFHDWTNLNYSSTSEPEQYRILAMGMGRPLEPGIYYIGVYNSSGDFHSSYSLLSRGIGDGYAIPVQPLDFEGGSASINDLEIREAAYFQVTVPENTPDWRLKLTPTSGETMLCVLQNTLPNVGAGDHPAPVSYPGNGFSGGFRVQRAGTEYYTLLPLHNENFIPAGTYYLAVVSEGVGPDQNMGRIGVGISSATLESITGIPVTSLGTLNPSGLITQADAIGGGDFEAYEFDIGDGVTVLEMRLLNAVGDPVAYMTPGSRLPTPGYYGVNGGQSVTHHIYPGGPLVINSPAAGTYRVSIVAPPDSDVTYTLQIRHVPFIQLNFSETENGNGDSHTHTHQTFAGEKTYYRIEVPETFDGQPVLGWRVRLQVSQGSVTLYAHQDYTQLEGNDGFSSIGSSNLIVVPPVLTPGTWYLETVSSGLSEYTLTSSPVLLQRSAWNMPAAGEAHDTPGLPPGPTFGDTGFQPNGDELPGDHGTDLGNGDWHFYAINVPAGNAGLLRHLLEAISGNPDLYVRAGGIPSFSAGQHYDRVMNAGSNTEYGNWVPANGRTETQLTPGTWYLGVHAAGNSNVRYRLRSSVGNVQTLALEGGSFTSQVLAAGDWRYYRVTIPENSPVQWVPTFSQQVGDVVMHLRDTTPPGCASSTGHHVDWASDNKNQGPYLSHDPAGSHPQNTPPLRPGQTYYLGFRANTDATFSVSSAISGGTVGIPPQIAFSNGVVSDEIPASGSLLYRVVVPPDALRFKFSTEFAGQMEVRIEQGTLPGLSGSQHYATSSSGGFSPNIYFPAYAGHPHYGWPWSGGHTYYIRLINLEESPLAFSFNMKGATPETDDEDEDSLPDAWELDMFETLAHGPDDDTDSDGHSNRFEWIAGLHPADPASRFSVQVSPVPGQPGQKAVSFSPLRSGRSYEVLQSTTLGVHDWHSLSSFTTEDSGDQRTVTDLDAGTVPRFYLVRIAFP